jgi:hypothetical protein
MYVERAPYEDNVFVSPLRACMCMHVSISRSLLLYLSNEFSIQNHLVSSYENLCNETRKIKFRNPQFDLRCLTGTGSSFLRLIEINFFKYTRIHVKHVPCCHGMARPQAADVDGGLQIWRIAANILNKQSRKTDKGWSSSLGAGRAASNYSP